MARGKTKKKPATPVKPNPNTETGLPPGQEKKMYSSVLDMATNYSLRDRIAAAAAQEQNGPANPVEWATERMWKFAALQDWVQSWDYATQAANRHNYNPDTGRRDDVISDAMILSAVQAEIAAA